MNNNDSRSLWRKSKPWLRFIFWGTVDVWMILWGGKETNWGKNFFKGLFGP